MVVTKQEKPYKDAAALLEPRYLDLDGLLGDLEYGIEVREGKFFGPTALEARPIEPTHRKVALASSGGGAAGAYSAGSIEVLLGRMRARGIPVDVLVGTSAGALNSYGVFVELMGKQNRQLAEHPDIKQPCSSFIAAIWSYLDRNKRTSSWVVGRRAWMVDLATKGFTPLRRWGLTLALILAVFIFNPFLFVSIFLFLGVEWALPAFIRDWGATGGDPAWQLAFLGLLSLAGLGLMVYVLMRAFGKSLFRDTPLLRLLANTGPDGDLTRVWRWPHEQAVDRARVLSRDLVREWYSRREDLPELIITATDITVGRECLFTLVRPDTYRNLVRQGWMAVQLDAQDDMAKPYRQVKGALFTLPENLIQCIVSSTAVPSAFPAQEIGIYGVEGRSDVRHRFVDGGVLNNSPIHLAIDAGATHIISLELDPLTTENPLSTDDRGVNYNILEAGVTTFTTLLDLAIERDIRSTVTWNRFLTAHPETLRERPPAKLVDGEAALPRDPKRILHLYRIAPASREIGTVEFDGRFKEGKRVASLRDIMRRGVVDLQGRHIWRATLQSIPVPRGSESSAPAR